MTTERQLISETTLPDLRRVGGRLRASCPIHGSDHQRSLSIQPEGVYAGFGHCFGCGAEVLVAEMNTEAAHRFQMLGSRRITAERLLRPIQHAQAEPEGWQREERNALQALEPRMQSALRQSERARTYLAERCIPVETAVRCGVGYLPPAWKDRPELRSVQKWIDRLIFPLSSPDGRGYAGRTLAGWRPGMNENEHKRLLEASGMVHRWVKTYPAGWFGLADLAPENKHLIIVEGPFDRLAIIAAGGDAEDIFALVGSRDNRAAAWLPAHITRTLIALDSDTSGREAAEALRQRLYLAGLTAAICTPTDDGQGKDWSERWRRGQHVAIWSVFEDLDRLVARTKDAEMPTPEQIISSKLPATRVMYRASTANYPSSHGECHIIPQGPKAWAGYINEHEHNEPLLLQVEQTLISQSGRLSEG